MKTPLLTLVLRRGLLLVILAGTLCGLAARAQTPQLMTYQGYLTDQNGAPLATNGPANYAVVFRIWNQPTGGATPLYGELQVVTVANGYFSVLLGQGTPYTSGGNTDPQPPLSAVFSTNNSASRYVELTVKGLANGSDVTILPRLQLVSAPYAFTAANANAVVDANGVPLVSGAGGSIVISNAAFSGKLVVSNVLQAANATLSTLSVSGNAGFGGTVVVTNAIQATTANVINLNLTGGIQMANNQTLSAYNGEGTLEYVFWPRWYDSTYLNYGLNGFHIRNDSSTEVMYMNNSGDVGIGTQNPIGLLQVQTSVQRSDPFRLTGIEYYQGYTDNNGISLLLGVNRPGNRQLWFADSAAVPGASSNNPVIRIMPDGSTIDSIAIDGVTTKPLHLGTYGSLTVMPNGFVGVDTTSPQCALDVENFGSTIAASGYEYLNGSSFGHITGANINVGIYCSSRIMTGAEFDAVSDARTKEIVGRSDTREDLATVRKMQITDFRKVDKVQFGGRLEKGVIAQEVEKIIPESVSTGTNFIPDIYALPASFGFTNQTLSVAMTQPHGLVVGDRVKLIAEGGVLTVTVAAVPTAWSFVAGGVEKEPRQLFVYGKEVGDFRSVNYDRLFTTGLGAIQELAKRMDQVEAREARMAELEQKASQVAALERQVSDLRKLVMQMAGSKSPKLAGEAADSGGAEPGKEQRTLTTASLAN